MKVGLKGGKVLEKYLKDNFGALGKASVDVGFMGGATEPDGTPVALVAALNEYGTGRMPPRPFMRTTVNLRTAFWVKNLGVALKRTKNNGPAALALVGLGMKEDIQDGIRDLWDPPLAPSTIARKGFDKPLIDTSTMLKSVTLKVKTGVNE